MRLSALAEGTTLVLGFGREGRALERLAAARCPTARIELHCDRAPERAPADWPVHLGPLESLDLVPDRVLRSPGVPVDLPALRRWRNAGIEITCISSLWFAERSDAFVVGVTGSKGKSTTSSLIAHLLRRSGKTVALGGNIGVPLLDLFDVRADVFVAELSSYQLADLQGRLDIGVMTRLFPEHLDWHGGEQAYYAAKLRLAELLQGRPLFINAGDPVLQASVRDRAGLVPVNRRETLHARSDGIWDAERQRLPAECSPLLGHHNLDNLALATAVVEEVLGAPLDLSEALPGFQPLAHRLQPVGESGGVRWINDSIATTPHATAAALESCRGDVVLIVGGLERGGDWTPVIERLSGRPLAGLVALPDNGASVVEGLVGAGCIEPSRVRLAGDLEQAVMDCEELCPAVGTVLLSPGAPSFPHFSDFEDRGRQFAAAVAARQRDGAVS